MVIKGWENVHLIQDFSTVWEMITSKEMSCPEKTNKHTWDTNNNTLGWETALTIYFCLENIYPSGFKDSLGLRVFQFKKKKKSQTITLKLESGREKTFSTSTVDFLLGEYMAKSKNVSKDIHPPSCDISLEEYLQRQCWLTPHFFCSVLALTQILSGFPQLFLQVADFSSPLLKLTLQDAVFLLHFLKHTFNWL